MMAWRSVTRIRRAATASVSRPMIAYRPSEFSRVRLQYNYDDAEFLADGEAHTVWAGLEVLYGSHPAHKY
jgi:hypothetical protein